MRDIKFRGIDTITGKFVNGNLFIKNENSPNTQYYIIYRFADELTFTEVLGNTIGQFTGLVDKNGVMVYEGDIVIVDGREGDVYYDRYAFAVRHFYKTSYDTPGDAFSESDDIEVLGNIYENKDLRRTSHYV